MKWPGGGRKGPGTEQRESKKENGAEVGYSTASSSSALRPATSMATALRVTNTPINAMGGSQQIFNEDAA